MERFAVKPVVETDTPMMERMSGDPEELVSHATTTGVDRYAVPKVMALLVAAAAIAATLAFGAVLLLPPPPPPNTPEYLP